MKYLILFLLFITIIVAGGVFVYLYLENSKPIQQPVVDNNLKVDGLVPFEQWHEQNKSQYKLK